MKDDSTQSDYSTVREPTRGQRESLHLERQDGQRRFARIQPHVVIALADESDIQGFAQSSIGDISLGGMFVKTPQPRPVGTTVRFKLPARGEIPALEMSGEVVRVISAFEVTDEHPNPGMGILFHPDDREAAEWLRELITYYALEENPANGQSLAGTA